MEAPFQIFIHWRKQNKTKQTNCFKDKTTQKGIERWDSTAAQTLMNPKRKNMSPETFTGTIYLKVGICACDK